MKRNPLKLAVLSVGAAVPLACAPSTFAQSADALLDKLVEKGILSSKEAKDLKQETDKGFTKAYQVKSGLPDWVTSLRIHGDLRLRSESFFADNAAAVDRHRFRYRLRPGITAVLKDNLEVGLRLTSSDPTTPNTQGGDPISGNTTFRHNGSKKFIYLDLAYAKWNAVNTADWSATFTGGKMENPFHFPSTEIFDKDYTPEGFAGEVTYKFNKDQSLKLTGAAFALDELSGSGRDPYLVAGQLRWNATWNPHLSSTLGGGFFSLLNRPALGTNAIPAQNQGNTRAGAAPKYGFNTYVVDAGATYLLDSFPAYKGSFPITVSGDFAHNATAPQDNQAYTLGFTLGKAGKRGTWQLDYRWTELQSDAWFEEFTESDFGAYYQQGPLGGSKGYVPGTNAKGHWVKLGYSPYDSLTLSIAYFATELIHPVPSGSESGSGRLQVDAVWRF